MSQLKDNLLNAYVNWIKDNIIMRELDQDVIEITTPFLDRHNDYLQIYVIKEKVGYRLTDDGYIISDLLMSGIDVKSSPKRRQLLDLILNGYGVKLSADDELYIEANEKDFPQRKHMLLQAMLAINDMFMTARETVASIFYEDVERFLRTNNIRYTENISFTGKSGLIHKFDFVIPRSPGKAPERIIQTLSNPTRDRAENLLFAWNDTRETRKTDSVLYAILNDKEEKVNDDIITALKKYDVKPLLWSKRQDHVEELAA